MSQRLRIRTAVLTGSIVVLLLPSLALALVPKPPAEPESLGSKEFSKRELYISTSTVPVESVATELANRAAWDRFYEANGTGFHVFIDPRSATAANIIGRVPMIPGAGNDLDLDAVARRLGRQVESVDAKVVDDLVRGFIVRHAEAIGIDSKQLGPTRAASDVSHLWQIHIPQEVNGIPVRHGRVAGTLNHGNLVLLGTESWGNVRIDTKPALTVEQAESIGFGFIGGKDRSDEPWKKPTLEIVPIAPPAYQSGEAFAGPIGAGIGHRLVWSFGFHRDKGHEAWEILVDAHTGEVLAFEDRNHYAAKKITGAVYPLTSTEICPSNDRCGTMQSDYPMPFANTGLPAPNDFTNSAGVFDYTSGTVTTTLVGRYVRVVDSCGPISESGMGDIDLGGVNGEHNCTTAGSSAGDTPSSRSSFYEVNKLAEQARGWLPGNTWLQGQLTTNVNINQTCNAFYSTTNGSINFYRSGGGCRNTGEIAAVFDHEWGHALDDNDTAGVLSVTSEAYADIAAIYRLEASCVGYGFLHTQDRGCGQTADGTGFNSNESLTGTHCILDCSGVRDTDWGKHADNTPDTPQNFNCPHCTTGSGPCGRQVHCDAGAMRQAAWDLVARDLRAPPFNMSSVDAFIVGNKLFYQGSGNVGNWHTCTCPSTSGGCGATNGYMQWLAADDDNGNLNDGTPHMTALFAAYNRHNLACPTPAAVNSGCAGGPTTAPTLTLAPGNNQMGLTWTAVPGAVTYRVLRSEGYAGCDFGKAVIANVAGTSFTDPAVANGRPYAYVVQAVGSSSACFGPSSPCVLAAPQPCAGAVSVNRSIYNCNDSMTISLVDSDLTGLGTHAVTVRSDTEPAGESVTLTESPAGSGRFTGTFATTGLPPAPGDGALSVNHGDTVTVRYVDASFCGTPDVGVEGTAAVDCVGPVITNVQATNVTGNTANITWTTNEPADSFVQYGPTPPGGSTASSATLVTSHDLKLTGLSECTDHVFRIRSTDVAGNSASDDNAGAFYAFATGRNVNPTYVSVNVPVAIPDNNPTGATSSIVISENKTVLDVDVKVQITHTFTGDLILSLIGPDGTAVTLSNRRGGSGDNFNDTIFDDQATTAIASGTAPFAGRFRPDQPLAAFNNKLSAGTWTLKVVDAAAIDVGSINKFEITFLYPAQACGPHAKRESRTLLGDACNGTGAGTDNGIWDAGEEGTISLTLRNDGTDPLTGVTATLVPTTPGVTMVRPTASYADIPVEATGTSLPPHLVAKLPPGFPCGAAVNFQVMISSDQGTWSDTIGLESGRTFSGDGTALFEDFASGIPAAWTVVDGGSGGTAPANTWTTANPGSRTASAPLASPFAIVDSDKAGLNATQDEQLITPVLDLAAATSVKLEFDQWFRWYSGGQAEKADVDVRSSRTGGAWTNVYRAEGASVPASCTAATCPTPDHRTIDITPQAAGAADVQIRFRYHSGSFEWWWMVDNVKVTFTAPPGCHMSVCTPLVGLPPPVPATMTVGKNVPDGSELTVLWNGACSVATTKILYGSIGSLPSYALGGAKCAISNPDTWAVGSAENLWFVLVNDDGSTTEGSWGLATAGERGGLSPSDTCGATTKDVSAGCP